MINCLSADDESIVLGVANPNVIVAILFVRFNNKIFEMETQKRKNEKQSR